jgi:hypothetical protein
MGKPHPPEAWQQLGRALELRRMQLGYGHGKRRRFAHERGLRLSEKTLARLERGEPHDYPPETLAHFEHLYALAPGAIEGYLATGRLAVAESPDPVGDDLRKAILALPALTDAEKQTVAAVARGLRAERAGAMAVAAAEPLAPVVPERPAELRYENDEMNAIAQQVWELNHDGQGDVFSIELLQDIVKFKWRERQRGVTERGGERTAAAG